MSATYPRVVHLISEYSAREAMGRTVTEAALRVPGEHHLITTQVHDGGAIFASVHELGGRIESFPLSARARLHAILDDLKPDIVHLHAGALGPLLALRSGLGRYPLVLTVYAWPGLPGLAAWRHAGLRALRSSNVLPARVLATAVLPPRVVRWSLRKLQPLGVLTPDPRVLDRLTDSGVPVHYLPSGAPVDSRRASFTPAPGAAPTVVFAGRSETVRGILTLVDAFTRVHAAVPSARLRLLLLPRAELAAVTAHVARSAVVGAIDVVTDPTPDLLAELAGAQVGAWPFLADYTTSPPAMAALEAMAVGLPVVGTDVACIRAALGPSTHGMLVPPGDTLALAGALISLLSDEAAWRRYADAGLNAAAARTWAQAADVTTRTYSPTASPHPSSYDDPACVSAGSGTVPAVDLQLGERALS